MSNYHKAGPLSCQRPTLAGQGEFFKFYLRRSASLKEKNIHKQMVTEPHDLVKCPLLLLRLILMSR
jgi:hypothetical protein